MFIKISTAIAIIAAFATGNTDAQVPDRITGIVVLEMSGELAAEYGKLTDAVKDDQAPKGLSISTTATVAQHLDGGRIRIEHSCPVMKNGALTQLVTLTATVDKTAIKTTRIPAATKLNSSPDAAKTDEESTVTKNDSTQMTLALADFTGVKLRSWNLAIEIGK